MAKIHFYYSAMNAGKTTTLLQSAYNYRERGMDVLLFTPLIDNRVESGLIASRIGLQSSAYSFAEDFDFYPFIEKKKKENPNLKCVLVDEAQFLKKSQVYGLSNVADQLKIPVLCYGLRTDFLGQPFEGSLYLLAWAEELIEIKTICHCGKKATMNLRVDTNGTAVCVGEQIEIGGNDRYVALCRRHYFEAIQP
jgi:thymidine kinase